jgi:hypothetical protein
MARCSVSSLPKKRVVLMPTTEGSVPREKITEIILRDQLKLLSRENSSLKRRLAVAKRRVVELEDQHPQ